MSELTSRRTTPAPPWETQRRPRRRIVGRTPKIQTWRIYATLECGHQTSYTISGARFDRGERGPKTVACWACPTVPR